MRKQAACWLRPDHAHHRRAAVDHIQFNRGGVAHIDDTPATVRPAICNAHDHGSTVTNVGDEHIRAEWQRGCAAVSPAGLEASPLAMSSLP